jgi:hypothetical protein
MNADDRTKGPDLCSVRALQGGEKAVEAESGERRASPTRGGLRWQHR